MSRSTLKKFFFFLLPLIACYLVISLLYFFSDIYSKKIGDLIARFIDQKIVIDQAVISPFKGLKLKNVQFQNAAGQTIFVDAVTLQFSPSELLHRKLILKNASFENVTLNGWQGEEVDSIEYLSSFISKKPKQRNHFFDIVLDQAVFCFSNLRLSFHDPKKEAESKTLALDICIDKKGNKLTCDGVLDYKRSSILNQVYAHINLPSRYLNFLLDIESIGKDLVVDQVKLYFKKYFLAGSGMIYDYKNVPRFDVRLYSSPIRLESLPTLKAFRPRGGEISMVEGHLSGVPRDLILTGEMAMPTLEVFLENEEMDVERASCNFLYSFKNNAIIFRELQGTVDGSLKFFVTGQISNIFSPLFNLRFQFLQLPLPKTLAKDSGLVVNLQGNIKDNRFEGAGGLAYSITNDRQYLVSLQNLLIVKGVSSNLGFPLDIHAASVSLQERSVTSEDKTILQNFIFQDFSSQLRLIGKQTFLDDVSMIGYGGRLSAKGFTHFNKGAGNYTFNVVLDNLNLENIKLSYPVYCELSGVVNGELKIDGKKETNVSGVVTADNFKLAKLEPLDNIADFIGINSIKEISGAQIATEFDLSSQTSVIKRFDLDSSEIFLRSNFNINTKKWLEGEVALSLPRKMLEESKIFKTLISIARERNELLDFVVHVSGFFWQLRSELIKSDFRDKLKEKVSIGLQRYIEKEANKGMDSTNK